MADNIVPDHQTYMQQLQDIWFGQWGSENRSPIYTAAGMLQDAFDTDITEELATIASATKGEDMRVAIHDALYKLDIAKPEPPSPPEEPVKISDLYSTDSYVEGDGVVEPIDSYGNMGPEFKWNAIGNTIDDNELTINIDAEADGIALLIIIGSTEDAVSFDTSYSLKYNGEYHEAVNRYTKVLTKPISKGDAVSATVTKRSGTVGYAALCLEYGISESGVSVSYEKDWTAAAYQTPSKSSSKRRLYITESVFKPQYAYDRVIARVDNNPIDIKWYVFSNCVFLHQDYQNDVHYSPTFEYTSTYGSYSNVVTLTVDLYE